MPKIDRHSKIVGWLKVALPLTALALLSTLFLLADRIDPTAAIRYAEVDVEALARDPRMSAPTYAGITSDGAAITLTAKAARPASGERTAAAEDVTLRLEMPDGGSTDMTAAQAELDTGAGELRLSGGVEIATSSGYRVTTGALTAALDRSGAESLAPVSATGPAVTIDAASFTLRHETGGETEPAYLLVFSGGVKLVYQPGG